MKSNRIIALDAFRGFTVALMILVNNPGSWGHIYAPLEHAPWEGCTPTDLVFPFFLFVVGVASFFSFKKFDFQLNGHTFWKLLRRSFLIFLIGFLLNLYPFFDTSEPLTLNNFLHRFTYIRVFGVLQRIACAYFVGVLLCLILKSTKKIATAGIALILIFWAILFAYNPQHPYDKKDNACRAFDLVVPGEAHIYKGYSRELSINNFDIVLTDSLNFRMIPKQESNIDLNRVSISSSENYALSKRVENGELLVSVTPRNNGTYAQASTNAISELKPARETLPFDPEGLLGVISAAATVIFGFLVGRMISFYSEDKQKVVLHLFLFGLTAIIVGMFWGQWFIISKPLWTGTYVLYAGGLAMVVLGFFIWLMDVKKYNSKLFNPFVAFGSNPLFLFVLSGLLAKTMAFPCFRIGNESLQGWIYNHIYKGIISPEFGSMLYAFTFMAVLWIIAEILHRKKIYIKV